MTTVGIVGAGAMGLAAAYHALKAGHRVTVYEADSVPGGMADNADLNGLSIERFYQFVCQADAATFALMRGLVIGHSMRWRCTTLCHLAPGEIRRWGHPLTPLASC